MGGLTPGPVNAASGAPAIGWAIVGAGSVARQFAADLARCSGATLRAVCSRTAASATGLAGMHRGARAFTSLEEMLALPGIDVVYVATPLELHAGHALRCLGAGKHVLVEKPFATDAKAAAEVVALARERKLFCMEAMWMRFIPAVCRARELLASGTIGEARMLIADFGVPVAFDPRSPEFDAARGGGSLLDRGVYAVSLAVGLFGEPLEVLGTASLAETGVDLHAGLLLRFSGGRTALLASMLDGYGGNEAVIVGTRGRIRLHEPFCRPDRLSLSLREPVPGAAGRQRAGAPSRADRLRTSWLFKRVRAAVAGTAALRGGSEFVAYAGNGYVHEAEEVMRCIRAGMTESPGMPLQQTLSVLQAMDRAMQDWQQRNL